MPGFFDVNDDPEDIEESYIQEAIPWQAAELWETSIAASPVWDQYSAEDHMYLADLYADAVFAGDFGAAEEFLEYLEIDWDYDDIHEFYEAYGALTQG